MLSAGTHHVGGSGLQIRPDNEANPEPTRTGCSTTLTPPSPGSTPDFPLIEGSAGVRGSAPSSPVQSTVILGESELSRSSACHPRALLRARVRERPLWVVAASARGRAPAPRRRRTRTNMNSQSARLSIRDDRPQCRTPHPAPERLVPSSPPKAPVSRRRHGGGLEVSFL